MKSTLIRISTGLIFTVLLVAFSGVVFAESGQPKYGGTLKIIVNGDVNSIGYVVDQISPADYFQRQPVIETLVRYDEEKQAIVPFLAESVEEDPQAKTITFKLRKGVKFHDGTPLDADAAIWNLEEIRKSANLGASWLGASSIEKKDDYSVVVHFHAWDNTFLRNMTWDSGMISPTAFKKNGIDWVRQNAVGTGPFKQVSYTRDVNKVFEKFDGYWQKGKPYLDRIEMLVVADPTVRLASFMSKEADMLRGMDPKNAHTLEKQKDVVLAKDKIQGLTMSLVGDSASPDSPFADVKVRQAMSYAIDRQALIDYVLYGYGRPMQQLSVPEAWSYNPDAKGYPYNPEKAKALLKEAGYPDGFSTTLYISTEGTGKKLFTAVQGYLVDVGIEAKLEMLNLGKYGEMYWATGWKDALFEANMLCYPEIGVMTRFFFEANSVLGMPKSIAHPEELEKVLQEFTVVSDWETQKELAHKAQYLLTDKYCLYTPILMQAGVTANYPWVKNENPHIKSPLSVYTFADYWIDK